MIAGRLLVALWCLSVALAAAIVRPFSTGADGMALSVPPEPGQVLFARSDLLSASVISGGEIAGYVLARMTIRIAATPDDGKAVAAAMRDLSEAFILYVSEGIDPQATTGWAQDVDRIAVALRDRALPISGRNIISAIFVEQFDYLDRQDVRAARSAHVATAGESFRRINASAAGSGRDRPAHP